MEELLQYLNSLFPLSNALYKHLSDTLKSKKYFKKDFLLKASHVSDKIFFIESGLVRCFYDKHEKEVCSWFMKEKDCIISVESFFQQKQSYETLVIISKRR